MIQSYLFCGQKKAQYMNLKRILNDHIQLNSPALALQIHIGITLV